MSSMPLTAGDVTVLAGISQLMLNGKNLAVEYRTGRFTWEYSHGWGLDYHALDGAGLTSAEKSQNLKLSSPYTTGFGMGYLLTDNVDVRLEFKQHAYDAQHPAGGKVDYITRSVGVGLFYRYQVTEHFIINPSIRYWPNVYSSLDNDQYEFDAGDGSTDIHKAKDLGVFANVSVGYLF